MRTTSSATFVLMGDHSQDATWPGRSAAPAQDEKGRPDWDRTSTSVVMARVAYRRAAPRTRDAAR